MLISYDKFWNYEHVIKLLTHINSILTGFHHFNSMCLISSITFASLVSETIALSIFLNE